MTANEVGVLNFIVEPFVSREQIKNYEYATGLYKIIPQNINKLAHAHAKPSDIISRIFLSNIFFGFSTIDFR